MESSKIKELAQDQQDYVVAMRREFHRSPELSGKEFHTRERLIEEIEKMGVPYEKLPDVMPAAMMPIWQCSLEQ